jgi:hypothetical protein
VALGNRGDPRSCPGGAAERRPQQHGGRVARYGKAAVELLLARSKSPNQPETRRRSDGGANTRLRERSPATSIERTKIVHRNDQS